MLVVENCVGDSIRLQLIHAATHPGAKLEHNNSVVTNNGHGEEEKAALLAALEAENEDEE